ncbi:L-tyrosine/L-tryptophan isonitrile synthase family protein [Fluviicola sp.]|uniref:L-tyrosine/L-tryptophan isonitrile synthase family protein n=1 Tax=Fluviicola sp. TaxID=1917219 RepID=UPI0031DE5912
MKTDNLYHIVCRNAVKLFELNGYETVNMPDIAKASSIDEDELYKRFGNKEDIILFLYRCINSDWQLQVASIPEGKLSERFETALKLKLDLMEPYEAFLGNIIGKLLEQNRALAVRSFQTAHIRAMGLKTIRRIIDGATDSGKLSKKVKDLPALLYLMHWSVMFLQLQTHDRESSDQAVRLMAKLIRKTNTFPLLVHFFPLINELGSWANKMTVDEDVHEHQVNRDILKIIFNNRKISDGTEACENGTCAACFEQHELNLDYFTSQSLPIHFILPAFPAKSPNEEKVIGKLPDLGEEIALNTLNNLCKEIRSVYEPGAHITICSDGRIFSELVAVSDDDISTYVQRINEVIEEQQLEFVEIVNLEDLLEGNSFNELRDTVLNTYAESLDRLYERLKTDEEFRKLFNGMHRFIVEDRKYLFPDLSTSKIKEESREIALKVIRNSNAWTRFLTYVYPQSIRLSIHTYHAHSAKIGVKITRAEDNWLTPWHGVIILKDDGYVLMKRKEAEAANAQLVSKNNQPHYYTLIQQG